MKEVVYSKDGEAISDFDAEKYARKILEDNIHVSVQSVIDWVRVLVAEGEINHEEVQFRFIDDSGREMVIPVNKHGRLPHWPRGFCDTNLNAIERLLKHAI